MKSKKWYVFLVFVALLQVLVLNDQNFFLVNLNIMWVIFILIAFRLEHTSLIPISIVLGWLDAVASAGDSLMGALYGLIIGVIIYWITSTAYWSLIWFRAVSVMIILLLSQIGQLLIHSMNFNMLIVTMLGLFSLMYFSISFGLAHIIEEPVHE